MKRIVRISLCMFLLVLAGACARHKIIPDRKLAQIFHDAFLANAYIGSEQVDIDSLTIYEPIFAGSGSKPRANITPAKSPSSTRSTTSPAGVSPARSMPTR